MICDGRGWGWGLICLSVTAGVHCTDVFCVNYCLVMSPHKAAYMLGKTTHNPHVNEVITRGYELRWVYKAFFGVRHAR
jgi:hypothetical protein